MRCLLSLWISISAGIAYGQAGSGGYFVNTIAGSSWVGDGGPAIAAILFQAEGVAVDVNVNIYVADAADNRVRQIRPDGTIRTIAGTGTRGFSGDGGPATAAQLNAPYGLACDSLGDLYIADLGNGRVRRVAPDGTIQTIAMLNAPRNLALDNSGNLYVSDFNAHRVYRLGADGKPAAIAGSGVQGYAGDGGAAATAQLAFPAGLAFDAQGSLYIGDTGNRVIRKVTGGVISTFSRATGPTGLAFDASANLWAADPLGGQLLIIPPSGAPTALAIAAREVAIANGSFYAAVGAALWRIANSGSASVVAGEGNPAHGDYGPAISARLNHPSGVAMDSSGSIYIADRDNHRVRRVAPDGTITTIAGMGVAGNAGDGGLATSAQLNSPNSVAVDSAGNLYIADTGNSRVRVVTPDGHIRAATLLGLVSPVYAIPDNHESIYISDAAQGKILKAGPNGVPATVLQGLKAPHGLAFDAQGGLYFTEAGAARVRRLAADGSLTDVAPGVWNTPRGIGIDATGRIYVADAGLQQVLRIEASGQATPVAGTGVAGLSGDGGPAATAQLSYPWDVAVTPNGAIAIADLDNSRIRELAIPPQPTVSVSTLADAVNAASLLPGPVAPGELVLVRNTGLTAAQAAATQVTFGSSQAQIVSADSNGILVIAPQSIAGASGTEVDVMYNGSPVAAIPEVVADVSPALFADASGQAAATNQDGTANSSANPAARGSVVSLFGTSLGTSGFPVMVTIAGYSADVLYAGPASYPGLFQINARVPTGYIGPGDLSVMVSVGASSSQAGVMIWVE
ncbi:MAG: hypothetical protein JO062_02750 [Bryobacterales bacterium]|nr:hypothetical protein [Bryobacterales bacterium]